VNDHNSPNVRIKIPGDVRLNPVTQHIDEDGVVVGTFQMVQQSHRLAHLIKRIGRQDRTELMLLLPFRPFHHSLRPWADSEPENLRAKLMQSGAQLAVDAIWASNPRSLKKGDTPRKPELDHALHGIL
jgi:hypothetical protein